MLLMAKIDSLFLFTKRRFVHTINNELPLEKTAKKQNPVVRHFARTT